MIVAGILGGMTIIFIIITIVAHIAENDNVLIGGLMLTFMFFMATLFVAPFEPNEFRTACQTYCTEEGYSYDSVKTEGEDKYCVCDTSLERHLIKKNIGVTIE